MINAALLGLVGWLVPGFHVAGFWSAVGGSLVISIVSFFLGYEGSGRGPGSRRTRTIYWTPRPPPPGKGPIIDV